MAKKCRSKNLKIKALLLELMRIKMIEDPFFPIITAEHAREAGRSTQINTRRRKGNGEEIKEKVNALMRKNRKGNNLKGE